MEGIYGASESPQREGGFVHLKAVALDTAETRPKHPAREELAPQRRHPFLSIEAHHGSKRTEIFGPLAVKPVPVNEGRFPW
jgi:hypothetical protein